MVGEILRSVTKSESDAAQIISDAKDQALAIKNGAKDDIAAKNTSEAVAFATESDKRREAVKEEEERKDKEFNIKVGEELEVLAQAASQKEERIIADLAKKIYEF